MLEPHAAWPPSLPIARPASTSLCQWTLQTTGLFQNLSHVSRCALMDRSRLYAHVLLVRSTTGAVVHGKRSHPDRARRLKALCQRTLCQATYKAAAYALRNRQVCRAGEAFGRVRKVKIGIADCSRPRSGVAALDSCLPRGLVARETRGVRCGGGGSKARLSGNPAESRYPCGVPGGSSGKLAIA
jgi:hypothetical protein